MMHVWDHATPDKNITHGGAWPEIEGGTPSKEVEHTRYMAHIKLAGSTLLVHISPVASCQHPIGAYLARFTNYRRETI